MDNYKMIDFGVETRAHEMWNMKCKHDKCGKNIGLGDLYVFILDSQDKYHTYCLECGKRVVNKKVERRMEELKKEVATLGKKQNEMNKIQTEGMCEEAMANLKKMHTKQLLKVLDHARYHGYYNPNKKTNLDGVAYFPLDTHYTLGMIKEVLATREHIPNKQESKAIRKAKIKKGK